MDLVVKSPCAGDRKWLHVKNLTFSFGPPTAALTTQTNTHTHTHMQFNYITLKFFKQGISALPYTRLNCPNICNF